MPYVLYVPVVLCLFAYGLCVVFVVYVVCVCLLCVLCVCLLMYVACLA